MNCLAKPGKNHGKVVLVPLSPCACNQNYALFLFPHSLFISIYFLISLLFPLFSLSLSSFLSFFPISLLVFSPPSNDPVLSWGKAGGVGAGLC